MISPYITNSVIESIVGLVLVNTGEQANAMTVSLFSEVAHHPTALWISIDQSSFTHCLLQSQPNFTLAVLNQNQQEIAIRCGTTSGRNEEKISKLELYSTNNNFLFLKGALSCTACRIRSSDVVGDHTVFIADILEAELESRTSHLRQLLLSDLI